MPTLFVGGQAVVADDGDRLLPAAGRKPLKPFPAGIQIVAGNSKSTTPQRLTVTYWDCGDR